MSETTTTDKWAKPQPVSGIEIAFPANALDYMPTYEECKAGLATLPRDESREWVAFQHAWFFDGLPANVAFHLRDGIDGNEAIRHLSVIQGSFAPKHEHKEAAVAYLASRWFEKVENFRKATA